MTIARIQSIAFKSLEKEKKYIKTPNDFSKFMRKYEPIFQETNSSYANLKEHISGAEYMKRRADKHISEQILLADPIEGSVKLGVDVVLWLKHAPINNRHEKDNKKNKTLFITIPPKILI